MTLLFRVDLFTIPADVLLLECWLSRLFASTRVFRCGKFSGKDCTAKFDRLPICDFHKTLLVVPSYAKKAVFSNRGQSLHGRFQSQSRYHRQWCIAL